MNAITEMSKRETFTTAEIEVLRSEFSKLNTVNTDRLSCFRKIFSDCGDKAIRQLSEARVKFVSSLALNECIRRGLVS
jgi:hypothetical protein